MLPGRIYRPEDIWYALLRWKWLILLPWLAVAVGTFIAGSFLPDRYRSESIIQVVPQRVSENYVRSTVTSRLDERLPVITQQILSRTRLERIIQDFNLYEDARQTTLMEDIVKGMRRDIGVTSVKGDAFQVNYASDDARMAMKVTERLASLFVEENLRDREVLAEGANQFLDSQLDDARRRLLEHEKRLEEYRKEFSGELPSQLQSNVQRIQSLQSNIQSLAESIIRDRDRRLILERQLADTMVEGALLGSGAAPVRPSETVMAAQPAAVQLEAARKDLAAMQLRLKPEHPDIRQGKSRLRELEKQAEAEALAAPVSSATEPTQTSPADTLRQKRVRDLNLEMETVDREIKRKENVQSRLQAEIPEIQRRIDSAPTRESEMIALTRDYDTLQKIYTGLLTKGEDAKVAANLERRQIGEQFKIIDVARLPERPFSPDRFIINGGGLVGGLAFGLLLAVLIEYKDSSFRSDDDVVSVLSLPVLATIPAMVTTAEKRTSRRTRLIVAAASLFLIAASGTVAMMWRSRILGWLR